MSRLSIDLSKEQHQQIKTLAAMQGKSIKEFILEKVFPATTDNSEQQAWEELKALLFERISAAESGAVSNKSFSQITNETIEKWKKSHDALSNQ